jgi:hypothetical protein
MEPDSSYSMLSALPHDIDRDVGVRGNYHAINGHRDGAQVWVGCNAFNLGCIWVDRENLISAVLQLAINSVGRLPRGAGNSRYSKALSLKELSD